MADERSTRTVLIGWDSANWEIITPLLDAGLLPNLGRLIARGVMGRMVTRGPILAPIVFNSVATGKYGDKHGVLGPNEVGQDKTIRPVTGLSRRTKAFWEIASQNGRRCHVVNFSATGPAEAVSGCFVSPAFFNVVPPSYRAPFAVPNKSVCPEETIEKLKDCVVTMEDIDVETMAMFVPRLRDLKPGDLRLARIAAAVAQSLSVHAVTARLMENDDWDIISVNYTAIDLLWRGFLRHHPPRLDWVDEQEFAIFREVAGSAVRLCDMLLGRLVQLAGDDAAALVYSARGYLPRERLPRPRPLGSPFSPELVYRGDGIFAMCAPGGRADELIHRVGSLDLCPTVLHLAGVASGADMDGRVLYDAFAERPQPIEPIESWDSTPPARGGEDRPPDDRLGFVSLSTPWAQQEARQVAVENAWNLVRSMLVAGRTVEALPLLIHLYYTNPLQTDRSVLVAEALFLEGLVPEAMEVMASIFEAFPSSPTGQFMGGMVALHDGQAYRALDLFEQASRTNPPFPQLYYYLGQAYLMSDRPAKAAEAYRRSIELVDAFPARVGLADALYRIGDYEQSAEAAARAASLEYTHPRCHFLLGRALAKLGEIDRAKDSFETALRLDPKDSLAGRALAALTGGQAGEIEFPPDVAAESADARAGHEASQQAVKDARRAIADWQSRFTEDLSEADERLDAYLAANATVRGVDWPTADAQQAEDAQRAGPDSSAWTVRPAFPSDQPAIQRAFPEVFTSAEVVEVLVIHPAGADDVRGGITLKVSDRDKLVIKLNLSVQGRPGQTEEDETTEILMTHLLRAAVARAAAGGGRHITFMFHEDPGQQALRRCLVRLGFEVTMLEGIETMDGATFRDRCLRIVERYKRQRAIPEDVRLVPLAEVSYDRVDEFLHTFFEDGAGVDFELLSPSISRVMLKGDKIIASMVGYISSPGTFLAARSCVHADFRQLWATPWLYGDGAKAGCEAGLTVIQFCTDELRYPEFVKIARRMGSKEIGRIYTMALPLQAPWQ
ncbi:hypothetical protein LCGC14_0467730 [marine sediment metagenome]|uniref:Uncharacterized protein n=1 Tax=marine sediment metagenome TaxID=412755 RepID=A0A0F9VM50_9ZZZZ